MAKLIALERTSITKSRVQTLNDKIRNRYKQERPAALIAFYFYKLFQHRFTIRKY